MYVSLLNETVFNQVTKFDIGDAQHSHFILNGCISLLLIHVIKMKSASRHENERVPNKKYEINEVVFMELIS